jgi:hypothetical protein
MRFADDRDTHAHLAPHTQRIRIYVEKPRLISRLASTRVDTDVVQSSFRAVAYLTTLVWSKVLRLEARSSTVCSLRLYGRLCGQTCDSRHCTTRALTGQTYSGSKKVYASKEVKAMPCRICIQLERAAAAAVRPDLPNILFGLNEAGIRNRARQKEERTLKAESDLEKHQRSCPKRADGPAF